MKQMIKRCGILILVVLMGGLMLAGCQLAQPELGQTETEDRFIGVYITFSSLSDYDITSGFDGIKRQETGNKIYATRTADSSFEFADFEGLALYCPKIITDEEHGDNYITAADPAISSVAISVSDAGLKEITGTIIMCQTHEIVFYPNTVYQTGSGDVYMLPAMGSSIDSLSNASLTLTQEIKSTQKINGEIEGFSSRAVVTIKTEQETDHYVVKQFNQDDELVASTVISRDRIPTELKAETTLAYAIIEKVIILADGSMRNDREIMDWSIATHSFVFYDERGLGVGTLVKLIT